MRLWEEREGGVSLTAVTIKVGVRGALPVSDCDLGDCRERERGREGERERGRGTTLRGHDTVHTSILHWRSAGSRAQKNIYYLYGNILVVSLRQSFNDVAPTPIGSRC